MVTDMSFDHNKLITKEATRLIRFPPLISNSHSLSMLEKSLLGHLLLLARPKSILELGVYQAVTTQFICEFLDINKLTGKVFGFDMPDQVAEIRLSNSIINQWESQDRLTLVPGMLPSSLKNWLLEFDQPFDLALVDATHNFWNVSGELDLLWPSLSINGYIICHDYSPSYQGVRDAVDYFVSCHHDAMAAPLISTDISFENDYRSSLIVIRHRPYTFHKQKIFHLYKWPEYRNNLKRVRFINWIWSLIRPVFKHNSI